MKQSDSFQTFDQEQHWKRIARQRQAKGISSIPFVETQDWMFLTDLDDAVEHIERQFQLLNKLEVISCH